MSTTDVTTKLHELSGAVNAALAEKERARRNLLKENVALTQEVQAWRDATGSPDPANLPTRITRPGLNALARDIKAMVEHFVSIRRVPQLDLADIRPVLEKHLAASNKNGHQIFKNEQELDVCTVCGAGEQELLDDTCTGHLKRMRLEDKRLFDQEIKAWKEATGRTFPYEAKRDLETLRQQVLDWQAASDRTAPRELEERLATLLVMTRHTPKKRMEEATQRLKTWVEKWLVQQTKPGLADIRKILEEFFPAKETNGHVKNGRGVCTVCGESGIPLDQFTCAEHLKMQMLMQTLSWQEAVGCTDPETYTAMAMRKDSPGSHVMAWQKATGCATPEVIAERLATFRKMLDCGVAEGIPDGIERLIQQKKAQFESITQLQGRLSEARKELAQAESQWDADRELWKNRWETFKGHVHELGHWVGCEQREQELTESFLLRCVEVAKLMVRQSRGELPDRTGPVVSLPGHTDMLCQFYDVCTDAGAGNELKHAEILAWLQERLRSLREPLRWQSAAPGSQLPVGYLQVIRRGASIQDVRLITIPKLTASFSNENWLLGPLPELPAPEAKELPPEMPDLLTLRCLEDDKLYLGTFHPITQRYQVFKGGRWFEAPMNEFTEVESC